MDQGGRCNREANQERGGGNELTLTLVLTEDGMAGWLAGWLIHALAAHYTQYTVV